MAWRGIIPFLIIAAVSFSVACGVSTSPSSSTPAISIALNPAPSNTNVAVGSTTGIQFTPVVSNDASNSGVDWAVTCSASTCGTLSIFPAFHSPSGTTVSYMPPASLPTASLVVNVTVFATADHAKNVTTPVTVSSYTTVLNGNYVLQVIGSDIASLGPNAYQAAGVFSFDGNGNVTSGQETINSSVSGFNSSEYTLQGANGTASTYYVGPDGRGNITLNLQQINNGPRPPFSQTFTLVVLSTSKALILEADSSSSSGGQNSASGTLELQDMTAAATTPTGAYAFVTNGTDANSPSGPLGGSAPAPTALGGVLNIDNNPSPGSISGNGSLADQDYSTMLESCTPPAGVTGSVSSPPSSPGVVTITLTGAACFATTPPGSIQFTGYIVDATHIRLIESDDVNGTSGFLTAGIAVSQGNAAGTFTNASLSGPYVYGVLGYDMSSFAPPFPPSSFTSAGVIQTDGSGGLRGGISDILFPGSDQAFTASGLSGGYSVDSTHIGRADLTPIFSGSSGSGPLPTVLFYLTGNGTPPLVLWSEGTDPTFPAVGVGIAYPQAANAAALSFGNPEKYGVRFTQVALGTENDGSGEMMSTITGVTGTLSGMVDDTNAIIGSSPLSPLLDTFTLPADSFGRLVGTFLNNPGSGSPGPFVDYYLVNHDEGFFVETDLLSSSAVSLGYFAQACDVTSATSCHVAAAAAASPKQARAPRVRIKPRIKP